MGWTVKIGKWDAAKYCKISLTEFESWVEAGCIKYTTKNTRLLEYNVFTYASLDRFVKWRQSVMSVGEIAKLYKVEEQLLRSAILSESLTAKLVADTYYCDILEFCVWNGKRRSMELKKSSITPPH